MLVIGLTGSIGMGKSVTASLFRAAGVPVHDSDAAVHRLYEGAAVAPIEAAFPGSTAAGVVDRAALGRLVLGDAQAMARLEAIVHPLVAANRTAFSQASRAAGARIVVFDVPLLFEIGYERRVDVVVVVDADVSVQKSRVLARPGMTLERFEAIIAKQIPSREKRRRAHFVIDTGRGIPSASRQVHALLRCLAGTAND
jgi:dephospho-CoA kinase